MKRKKDYSLTAKERKALRESEESKSNNVARSTDTTEGVESENVPESVGDEVAVKQPMTKKSVWIMITCIVLALVIILTAVLLLVLQPQTSKYPRATFRLSNGSTITMEIYEDEAPIAATNFLFLAQIGFFDGTIIYDVQPERNFMRFGAYKGYGTDETKYKDADFIANIPQKMFNIVNADEQYFDKAESNKFGYRLKKDLNSTTRYGDEAFVVSYNNANAGDFVINLIDNNRDFRVGTSSIASNLVAFGKFADEESQKILRDIYALDKNYHTGVSNTVGTDPVIRIESVKISNLNKKKWKNFESVSYMNTAYDGKTAFSNWYNA